MCWRIHGLLFPGIMDWILCYHIWLNHAISVSCNSVSLHTRLSIYNKIYINHSHLTCLYYVICILHHVILTVYYFLFGWLMQLFTWLNWKLYLRNIYKNIQHKYRIILTKYITQTLQTKIIVTNKFMLAVLHYCHVYNENTLIILILVCSICVLVHIPYKNKVWT